MAGSILEQNVVTHTLSDQTLTAFFLKANSTSHTASEIITQKNITHSTFISAKAVVTAEYQSVRCAATSRMSQFHLQFLLFVSRHCSFCHRQCLQSLLSHNETEAETFSYGGGTLERDQYGCVPDFILLHFYFPLGEGCVLDLRTLRNPSSAG